MTESIGQAGRPQLIEAPAIRLGSARVLLPLLAVQADPANGGCWVWAVGAVDAGPCGPVWRCFDPDFGAQAVVEASVDLPRALARLPEAQRAGLGAATVEPCGPDPAAAAGDAQALRVRLYRARWRPGEPPVRSAMLGERALG